MKHRSIIAMLLVLIVLILFTGCESDNDGDDRADDKDKEKVTEAVKEPEKNDTIVFDISPCIALKFNGYEGMGVVSWELDPEKQYAIESLVSEKYARRAQNNAKASQKDGDKKGEEGGEETDTPIDPAYYIDMSPLFYTLSCVVTPETELKNGDTVTVKLSLDERWSKSFDVALETTEFTCTVSGLTVIQSIDPFEGLTVNLSGSEADTIIKLDDSACSDFIRNYVLFDYEKRDVYSNGDHFTVYAKWGDNFNLNNEEKVYMMSRDEMSVDISGLNMYPQTVENVDLTSTLQGCWEGTNGRVTDYLFNTLNESSYNHVFQFNGVSLSQWHSEFVYTNMKMNCEKIYFLKPKYNTGAQSKIILIVKLEYDVHGDEVDGIYDVHVGSAYLAREITDFLVDPQGNLVNVGNYSFLNSDWKEDVRNDTTFDTFYNRIIVPYITDYIVDEINMEKYKDVFSARIATE